jgi:hypothetical protein
LTPPSALATTAGTRYNSSLDHPGLRAVEDLAMDSFATAALPVRRLLYRDDPYIGFNPAEHPEDRQGWGSEHAIFSVLMRKLRPAVIVEVGSWKGMSAINMARLRKSDASPFEIICVDTWLGSPGLYTRKDDPFAESLRFKNGYPQLYYTFLANVVAAGHSDVVTPLALPSTLAAQVLADFGVKADLIYIDAAHDYKSVADDLESFWPLLSDDGALFGDDYVTWPGVTRAANEFSAKVQRPLYGSLGKFVIPKSPKFSMSVAFSA